MRLKCLKLIGFKSFIDLGKFEFPSNLVGIVGPNGCGKSNAIDAVRWVMGERSAKHLRGMQMSDVIFNGSNSRKPIGKASVEMLFDNSDGKIIGPYAAYNDILVKRTVTRDGLSDYYLNNTKVRRRDVMDLFSGTGLGPRSYAIIEQGTISQFIEAKPEYIRNMIEEAAGVSQYKERRRETENRIKHSRENLDRIQDLLDEISKNIRRLERQAKVAAYYKQLKQQQKLVAAQLLAIEWQQQTNIVDQWQHQIQQQQIQLETERAKLQKNATEAENLYQQQLQTSGNLSKTQHEFLQVKSELRELEQKSQDFTEQLSQIVVDLKQSDLSQTSVDLVADKDRISEINQWLADNQPQYNYLQQQQTELQAKQQNTEHKLSEIQQQEQQLERQISQTTQNITTEKFKLNQLADRKIALQNRQHNLQAEPLSEAVTDNQQLTDKQITAATELEALASQQQQHKQQLKQFKAEITELNLHLSQQQQEYQTNTGKLSSLTTLQANLLGKSNIMQWLANNNLSNNLRLAENLQIDAGWELAAEIVLGDYLQAICLIDDNLPKDLEVTSTTILLQLGSINNSENSSLSTLQSKVKSKYTLEEMLANVLIADTFELALELRKSLKSQQTVVCKSGIWLGKNWLKILATDNNNQQNILLREQEIVKLTASTEAIKSAIEQTKIEIKLINDKSLAIEAQLDNVNQQYNNTQIINAKLLAELATLDANKIQREKRQQQINDEISNINQQLQKITNDDDECQQKLQILITELANLTNLLPNIAKQQQDLSSYFALAKTNLISARDKLQQLSLQFEAKKSQLAVTNTHIERIERQLETETARIEILQQRQQKIQQQLPEIKQKISSLIANQLIAEKSFITAQQQVSTIEHQYKKQQDFGIVLTKLVAELQAELEQYKLNSQESVILVKNLQQKLSQTEFNATDLLQNMLADNININQHQQLAESLANKILKLGDINFASIAEFDAESERKVYIESQVQDLLSTLATLESAINKIDQETKDRFKTTFDLINSGLQRLFPKLFGGGKAYLSLTSDDLLDTGVTIMAQPPGKKNSTIYLLSGGEKALTAVALVFAIFELNPAPFCLLDEVDAPLDDANVARFCTLVKKMSDKVQFIFITHNKITMELAQQLTGVTMHEPGVSRLVTVDLEKAVAMASHNLEINND